MKTLKINPKRKMKFKLFTKAAQLFIGSNDLIYSVGE